MSLEALSTQGSKVQVDTGSGLVDWLGTQDINAPDGDNGTFDAYDIADAVAKQKGTGVSEVGSLTFEYLLDPTDTVHQWVQDRHLAGGKDVSVKVFISASGKTKTGTGTLTKHEEKGSKKDGWKVSVEIKLNDQWTVVHPS